MRSSRTPRSSFPRRSRTVSSSKPPAACDALMVGRGTLAMTVRLQNDDTASSTRGIPVDHVVWRILKSRLASGDGWVVARLAPLAAIHLTALAILLWSEADWDAQAAFVFTWGFLNFFWLALLRRPSISGALSLSLVVILIL